ncbi:MAG TPA: hypothetical protein VKV33_10420, partial [Streptosporangiaceae bacterium]|nr:hypothetical protein [Streptosporangiaceae bacterium]
MTPLRALVVGAGGMGRAWGRTIAVRPDVVLAGWVDVIGERAVLAAAELGAGDVRCGDDLEAALGSVRPDFVVDAAVPEAHTDV